MYYDLCIHHRHKHHLYNSVVPNTLIDSFFNATISCSALRRMMRAIKGTYMPPSRPSILRKLLAVSYMSLPQEILLAFTLSYIIILLYYKYQNARSFRLVNYTGINGTATINISHCCLLKTTTGSRST